MNPLAGERIGEPGSIAREQHAPARHIGVPTHPKMLPCNMRQVLHTELLRRVSGQQVAGDRPQLRLVRLRRKRSHADVDVVALGKQPPIAALQRCKVEDQIVRCAATGQLRGKLRIGHAGLQREATRVPCSRRRLAEPPCLSVGTVRADQHRGAQRLLALRRPNI